MASPPSPSQITDTANNSYFCKNCGTRLIHTTPVSTPLFNVEVPLCTYHTALLPAHACPIEDVVLMHHLVSCGLHYILTLVLTVQSTTEQESRVRKRRVPGRFGLGQGDPHLDQERCKQSPIADCCLIPFGVGWKKKESIRGDHRAPNSPKPIISQPTYHSESCGSYATHETKLTPG